MIPPIFTICAADAGVTALLGTAPVRLFPFGEAPPDVARPYAVWQTIAGYPENLLADLPEDDFYSVQVDVYAASSDDALDAAQALRDALEPETYITSWGNTGRDSETEDYRYTFGVDFIENR